MEFLECAKDDLIVNYKAGAGYLRVKLFSKRHRFLAP